MNHTSEQDRKERRLPPLVISLSYPHKRAPNQKHVQRLIERAIKKFPVIGQKGLEAETIRLVGTYFVRCLGKPKITFDDR